MIKIFTIIAFIGVIFGFNSYGQAPVIAYNTPDTCVVGSPISPLIPTSIGDAVVKYSYSGLPAGLNLNTRTGKITGTPASAGISNVTITAENAKGVTGNCQIKIQVNPATPIAPVTIKYNSPDTLNVGTATTPLTPVVANGKAVGYSASPALPDGLVINAITGIITGKPTTSTTTGTDYTITAKNAKGEPITSVIKISVYSPLPTITYVSENVFIVGADISTLSPAITNGSGAKYSISPNLPAGLKFDSANGTITGKPRAASPATKYMVTVTTAAGRASFSLLIMVIAKDAIAVGDNSIKQNAPATKGNADTAMSYVFSQSCNGAYNFNVKIKPNKSGGIIYINNSAGLLNQVAVKATAKSSANSKSAPVKKPVVAKDSVISSAVNTPDTAFIYSKKSGFDEGDFITWVKNMYPKLNDDCAKYLAFKVKDELRWQDTTLNKVTSAGAATPAPKVKAVKKSQLIKPGSVYIISTQAFIDTAKYNTKQTKYSRPITIPIRVKGNYDSTANQLVFVNTDSILTNHPHIDTVTITEDGWNAAKANNGEMNITTRITTTSVKDTLKEREVGYLVIPGQTQESAGSQEIILKQGLYLKDNPFWMEVGSNFDLLNGVQANNLYAGVLAFVKDIGKVTIRGHTYPISFTGGVYESKSSSVSASSDSGIIYRNGSSYNSIPNKGYPFYRDTGSVKSTATVQSIGLFFEPLLLLTNKESKENGLHIYLSSYLEMLWQRVNTTFSYPSGHTDTLYDQNIGSIYLHNYKENTTSLDYRSHYFGFGLPIYIKEDAYTFYLNPVLGITNQQFVFTQPSQYISDFIPDYKINQSMDPNPLSNFETPKKPWNKFYIAQFRLTSEQYGVSFTGEVRGFILRQSKPQISLSISKKFDVGKLVSTILGN